MKYRIGQWTFDTNTNVLVASGHKKTLPNLLSSLLQLLIHENGTVITRDQLIETLWKNRYVNEGALSRAIAELRKELGDSANQPDYIKTVPKKGYIFIHEVTHIEEEIKKKKTFFATIIISSIIAVLVFYLALFFASPNHEFDGLIQALRTSERITADQGMENQPVLSHDGTKLAYSQVFEGQSSVIVYDVIDQKPAMTFKRGDMLLRSPVFSHSGRQLIMTAETRYGCQLFWVNLVTLDEKLFSSCANISESVIIAWRENDQSVVVSDYEQKHGTIALFEIDINTYKRRQITFPQSSDLFDMSPNMSPNGEYLSFTRGNHSVRNVLLLKINESNASPVNLTSNTHYTVSHTWYDEKHIIMDSDYTGERQLWMININTGDTQLVGARGAQFPSLDRQNKQMAFQVAHYEANIWMLNVKTLQKSLVINSTKYDNNPAYHPNGNQLVYASNRQSHGDIWLYDIREKSDKKLLQISGTKLSRPAWSKNGDKILVTANNDTGLWSYEYDLLSQRYKKLPFKDENLAAHYVEDIIYAMSKPINGESNLLKLDAQGNTTTLNISGISRFIPLPNQKFVISKANKHGLFIIDENGNNESLLIKDFPSVALNHWVVSGHDVYYRESNIDIGIWKINTQTFEKEKVTEYFPDSVGPSMSISPNQETVLFTKTDRAESDIFITTIQ